MFSKKQSSLRANVVTQKTSGNAFTREGLKKGYETKSMEGALKYTSTGNDFVDQFGSAARYRKPRSYAEISQDMSTLWGQNPRLAIAFLIYLRLITRVVKFFDGSGTSVVQRGQGLKHESIFRMIWLAVNQPRAFQKNIPLFIAVGSWKDIFTMMRYDLEWNGWDDRTLSWRFMSDIIIAGLGNENTSDLVKKYLPQLKAWNKCKTVSAQANNYIAKYLAYRLFSGNEGGFSIDSNNIRAYRKYRLLKSSGKAHQWQQLISRGKLLEINFNTIHGRALSLLVGGKFLKNNKLEAEYERWLDKQPIVKFTGYVYELFKDKFVNGTIKPYQDKTVNKQFDMLVETAKKNTDSITKFLVVMDSSGSMTSNAVGLDVSAYNIAKSFALFFSYFLEGPFKNTFMQFSNTAKLHEWKGATPLDKFRGWNTSEIAGTNFNSVSKVFVSLKQRGVPESDFPEGLLCLSDGEFHRTGYSTETETFKRTLLFGGFSQTYVDNLKFVFWDIPNTYYGSTNKTKFESMGTAKNIFYMSGFDGAGLAFITGKTKEDKVPETAEDLFKVAMSQEVMDKIQL